MELQAFSGAVFPTGGISLGATGGVGVPPTVTLSGELVLPVPPRLDSAGSGVEVPQRVTLSPGGIEIEVTADAWPC